MFYKVIDKSENIRIISTEKLKELKEPMLVELEDIRVPLSILKLANPNLAN